MSGSDLFTGTLDILILRTLEAAPLHGYAVGKALRDRSGGVLAVEEGALYPALLRRPTMPVKFPGTLDCCDDPLNSGSIFPHVCVAP
jgi:hypothetical protein